MVNNPTLLTMPIAENGQKNTIPATQAAAGDGLLSQSTGFPPETSLPLGAGGKAVKREDFNGALNLLSNLAFYSQKGWTFQYDESQAYYKGCIVMDATDGLRYECINDVAAGEILPSADTQNEYWREYSPGGVPLGSIIPYAANADTPPYSFLFCEGQAISRTMYPDLFDLIGTTYGEGDGSTTFNLPNMLSRYPQGDTTAGTVKAAGLPNIEGNFAIRAWGAQTTGSSVSNVTGAFEATRDGTASNIAANNSVEGYYSQISLDASRSSAIYGNSDTVTPPTLTVRWIIKAYDAPTPSSAQIDFSQYASDLARRLTREQTPAFNKRDVITVSGTYTAPVTGWYRIAVKGGGGGGGGGAIGTYAVCAPGGGEGGKTIAYEKMTAGDTAAVVIGAGGTGGAASTTSSYTPGGTGGSSSVTVNNNVYIGGGGGASSAGGGVGGSGTIPGANGGSLNRQNVNGYGASGGGNGGGRGGSYSSGGLAGTNGGGGGGGGATTSTAQPGGNGGDGYAEFSYFDPSLN